jgi:hypothetical protein
MHTKWSIRSWYILRKIWERYVQTKLDEHFMAERLIPGEAQMTHFRPADFLSFLHDEHQNDALD